MSPLWRDEIGIFLAPHKLTLARMNRGVRPKSAGETSWTNELIDDTHWSATLAALDNLLARSEWQRAAARVVISDFWVRYACVPYSAALSGEAERMTHACHSVRRPPPRSRPGLTRGKAGRDERVASSVPGIVSRCASLPPLGHPIKIRESEIAEPKREQHEGAE